MCETKQGLVNALSEYDQKEITQIYKQAWGRKNSDAMLDFCIGERVQFTGRGGSIQKGTITKINRKRLSVDVDGFFSDWLVPPTMLTKI